MLVLVNYDYSYRRIVSRNGRNINLGSIELINETKMFEVGNLERLYPAMKKFCEGMRFAWNLNDIPENTSIFYIKWYLPDDGRQKKFI